MVTAEDDDETLMEVLRIALEWQLTEDEWRSVRHDLDRLVVAWSGPGRETVGEVISPLVKRAGSRAAGGLADAAPAAPRRPMPRDVRDVVYRLLRQIGTSDGDQQNDPPRRPQ